MNYREELNSQYTKFSQREILPEATRVIVAPFVGPVTITATPLGLSSLFFEHQLVEEDKAQPDITQFLDDAEVQIMQYFAGERTDFDIKLDLSEGTDFQKRAWGVLRKIPFAETLTYGEQAEKMGCPKGARAVGGANGANPIPLIIPCHRVLSGSGLGGYSGGLGIKEKLLGLELNYSKKENPRLMAILEKAQKDARTESRP